MASSLGSEAEPSPFLNMPKYYHTIINLLGLSIIIWVGVDIFYRVAVSEIEEIKTQSVVTKKAPDIKEDIMPAGSFKSITGRNLFGTVKKASKNNTSENIEGLEPSSLNVALLGTVTGNNQDARAVIEEIGKRKQGLYKVGDSIQNAVIKRILDGKVVLRVGNEDEVLSIEDSFSSGSSRTGKIDPVKTSNNRAFSTITVKRADVMRALRDINKLMSQVFISPHFKNGKADGLEVTRIKRGSFFASLGLKNGDVIQKINNRPIKSPDDAMAFYNRLKRGSRVSIEITRGQKPKTINYRFR
jgi:general secretion pathway protein C